MLCLTFVYASAKQLASINTSTAAYSFVSGECNAGYAIQLLVSTSMLL